MLKGKLGVNLRHRVTFTNYLCNRVCFESIYVGGLFCMEAANAIGNKAWLAIAIGDTGADVDGAAIATDNTRWRGGEQYM